MSNRPLHYWDSVCCISLLRGDAHRIVACRSTIDGAEEGKIEIAVSTLTIAEVLHLKGEPPLLAEQRSMIRAFFRRSIFLLVEVDRHIAEHAQSLYWDHGIKPKDAIHVASALRVNAVYLDTFDEGLLSKSEAVGGSPAMIIQHPKYEPPPSTNRPAKNSHPGQLEIDVVKPH
jgi:predicted nucleic acid-binding protein